VREWGGERMGSDEGGGWGSTISMKNRDEVAVAGSSS
jgi:hypothetical protein